MKDFDIVVVESKDWIHGRREQKITTSLHIHKENYLAHYKPVLEKRNEEN